MLDFFIKMLQFLEVQLTINQQWFNKQQTGTNIEPGQRRIYGSPGLGELNPDVHHMPKLSLTSKGNCLWNED